MMEEKEKDNPDSWEFEQNISNMFNNNRKKENPKKDKNSRIKVLLLTLLFLIVYYILLHYYGNKVAGKITLFFEIAIVLISIVPLVPILWPFIKRKVKKYIPIIVIPIIALIAVIVVLNIYTKGNVSLTSSDIFSFCGDYLAFLGTFCLGYFIYIQDRTKMIEEKRTKVRLLITLMENANAGLLNLRRLAENDDFIKVPENRNRIQLIPYNSDWILYYYEYEALTGENSDLKDTLNSFFNNIMRVNVAIENGQIEIANRTCQRYIENELYSISKYNEWDAIFCLSAVCSDFYYDTKSWIEENETVDLINELCKKYYFIIENYVYVWLLEHNVKVTTEEDSLDREIVDWLLLNSPEIKEKIKFPTDKRIISKVVFDCSLKFESKSDKVNYVWGEYSLK